MSDSFLDKLKKSVLAGAHSSATRIEEAARAGKLHLDLMAEKRKLSREYTELGKEAHMSLAEGSLPALAARPGVNEMVRNIEKHAQSIAELETRLSQAQRKPKGP